MPFASDELERLAQQRVGTTLRGKLRLDHLLGVGGTAAVYAATHRTGKRYAVKILHPHLLFDERMRQRFFREGYVVNRIDHPGVVCVVDDDVDEHRAMFLVMDLLEGETIESLAARQGGRLPVGDVLSVADQTLDVLVVAHRLQIIHRDLKPENLFLIRDGTIKVLDFGIARLVELSGRTLATRAGTIMGTPAFMPPEQARGRLDEIDGRTDIWAIGASMFSLLTGRLVHQARTANELLLAAMRDHAPKLRDVWPSASSGLANIVDRALAFDRDARWPDVEAMQAAVRAERERNPVPLFFKTREFDPEETTRDDPAAFSETAEDAVPRGLARTTAVQAPSTRVDVISTSAVDTEDPVDAFLRRGHARASSDDLSGAAEDFTRVLELDPHCAVALYNRGVVRHRLRDYVGALADYDNALAAAPSFSDARFNRELCLREQAPRRTTKE